MLEALGATDAGFILACTPDSPRAIPASELAAAAEPLASWPRPSPSVDDAVDRALGLASPDDFVLVTGSLYVVGPARTFLQSEVDAMTATRDALSPSAKPNDPCWCGTGKKFKRCHKPSTDRMVAGHR